MLGFPLSGGKNKHLYLEYIYNVKCIIAGETWSVDPGDNSCVIFLFWCPSSITQHEPFE